MIHVRPDPRLRKTPQLVPLRLRGAGRLRGTRMLVTRGVDHMTAQGAVDRASIHQNMERARASFHQLLDEAADGDLGRGSNGTRWTNEQLHFHMLFGYLIVRALLPLVRVFGRLPDNCRQNLRLPPQRCQQTIRHRQLPRIMHRRNDIQPKTNGHQTRPRHRLSAPQPSLDAETEERLRRAMAFPARWDPYFEDTMTLADVYQYATQHFDHHRQQLTIQDGRSK